MSANKKLFSNSIVVIIGTVVSSVFSYLFNMVMGRKLGPALYGDLVTLLSLLLIVNVGGNAILNISMKYSSKLFAADKKHLIYSFIMKMGKYVFLIALLIVIIGLIFIGPISSLLSMSNKISLVVAYISVFAGFLIMINKGVLQGLQKFVPISYINSSEMICRLLLGVLLVSLGFSLNGAISSVVLATFISYLVSFYFIKKYLFDSTKDLVEIKKEQDLGIGKREIISYSWPTLIAMILLTILLNLDIIVIKYYFPPVDAGLYAAISTVAKIIFYISGPIVMVMFPVLSKQKYSGEKHYKTLAITLLITISMGAVILFAYYLFPKTIIAILYGSQYAEAYRFLSFSGAFMLLYSVINMLINYYLAIERFFVLWLLAITIFAQIILFIFYHNSIELILRLFVFTLVSLFALIVMYYLFERKQLILSYFKNGNKKS